MKLFKFKVVGLDARATVMAKTLEEAVEALSKKVADDIEVTLEKEADTSDIKHPLIFDNTIPPF